MRMVKHAKVFKIGRRRAINIPPEFDFLGDDVTITKEGDGRIVVRPVETRSDLFEWLDSLESLDEEFPNLDESLGPPEEVNL